MLSLQRYFDLRQEAQESWEYHICDEIVYLPEATTILRDREFIGIPGVSLPEIYLKRDAWIELQFSLVGDRDAYYMAILESVNAQVERHLDNHARTVGLDANNVSLCDLREINGKFAAVRGDTTMLVEVTDCVQPPKRVAFVGCASLVRLKRLDLVNSSKRNSSNLPVKSFDIFISS